VHTLNPSLYLPNRIPSASKSVSKWKRKRSFRGLLGSLGGVEVSRALAVKEGALGGLPRESLVADLVRKHRQEKHVRNQPSEYCHVKMSEFRKALL